MDIEFFENGIYLNIEVTDEKDVRLYNCSPNKIERKPTDTSKYRLVEVHESGENQNDHHGNKHTGSSPGSKLKYLGHSITRNNYGLKIVFKQEYNRLLVDTHIQFFNNIGVIRTWNVLENRGEIERPIEFLSSFALTGLSNSDEEYRNKNSLVYIPHNTWYGEAQWKSYSLGELGYDVVNNFSVKRIKCSNSGSWACGEYLPMGCFNNTKSNTSILWQIETHGSWHWEISDIADELYLQLYGPTYQESGFLKILRPGEKFESVKSALSIVNGDFQNGIKELTFYRRLIRRENQDNKDPKVIFNDYMNCLSGDPTTEKLIPLIDTASEAGCKYFCIDAGWYDDGPWWDGVGEWLPAKKRFPNGIFEPLNYIREKKMIPGLWLELEVMGINCPLVDKVPKNWFFQRNGRVVIDEGRYQLDYRNAEVREYATNVIDRLVTKYGVGYIKMDYNINSGLGTELNSDSVGEGLLEHTRAYYKWLKDTFDKYPDLTIENCSSGGMRMTYSLLELQSIQSVSDQTDYIKNAVIAVNAPTAVTPEQAAIWSYPLKDGDLEETIFNMVNAILLRIHMSGHISTLSKERLSVVKEGIKFHHSISKKLANGFPIWPIGLASMDDEIISMGIVCKNEVFIAVWNIRSENEVVIPLTRVPHRIKGANLVYPENISTKFELTNSDSLKVDISQGCARIFKLDF